MRLPPANLAVVLLLPVEWIAGVVLLWTAPQHVGFGNDQPPDLVAWLGVAAIVAGQLAAVLHRGGRGVMPLVALVLGAAGFAALTLLESIAHAKLI